MGSGVTGITVPEYFQNPQYDPSPKHYQGGEIGILLIHGYTATPVEVDWLAQYLNKHGYTVVCPLLPGHGTTIEDLHRCQWIDWVNHAESEYKKLSNTCDLVFVGGESLGGLISLFLALNNPDIAALLLYAPALIAQNRLTNLSTLLRFFVKSIKKRRARSASSIVEERWQGYTLDSVPAAAQVVKLQRLVRKSLPQITQPMLIIQGRLDQTIRPEGAEEIYSSVSSPIKELVWMPESTHCILLDHEREQTASRTIDFLEQILSSLKDHEIGGIM